MFVKTIRRSQLHHFGINFCNYFILLNQTKGSVDGVVLQLPAGKGRSVVWVVQ